MNGRFVPKHGHFIGNKPSPTYKSWQAMIARCTNPKHPAFDKYGGAGISICRAWLTDFTNFLADMGERPDGKTLDRWPTKNGNYGPDNCRWATPAEQQRNRRDNALYEFGGRECTAAEIYELSGYTKSITSLRHKLRRGRSVASALIAAFSMFVVLLHSRPSDAHDIYTGLHGKNSQLCCGGTDCAATTYREKGGNFEFLTREKEWVTIPQERITFLPIPGDPPSDDSHHAHLCYRPAHDYDKTGPMAENVFGDIYLYCAFVPPGNI